MKRYILPLCAALLSIICGCSEFAGEPVTQEFAFSGTYTELDVADAFNVTVSKDVSKVVVTAGEKVMPKVVVETVDGILKIHLRGAFGIRSGWSEMKAVVPYNSKLKKIDFSGASEFRSDFPLEDDRVDIHLSGASKFYGKVAARSLDLAMSGASYTDVAGQANQLNLDLSGASKMSDKSSGRRYQFSCSKCEGAMSGASETYFHCDGDIRVEISGASKLHYSGNATTGDCRVSGGSAIAHDTL